VTSLFIHADTVLLVLKSSFLPGTAAQINCFVQHYKPWVLLPGVLEQRLI